MVAVIDTSRHPLMHGGAPAWASGWGEDAKGVFVEIRVKDVVQVLRWCRPGRFLMGAGSDDPDARDLERPQTEISFREGFWLGDTPVTQKFYSALMGENPSRFESPNRPVERVSWQDAKAFIAQLNSTQDQLNLRLPSEAEWEYACRARTLTPYWWGTQWDDAKANAQGHVGKTRDVGTYPGNPWGFADMSGNVWEWCEDVWHESHEGAVPDGAPRQPIGEQEKTVRVVRGGSWSGTARDCRSAARFRFHPGDRGADLGFRLARGQ